MRAAPLWKSKKHEANDRTETRAVEKMLDRTLRNDPPGTGRLWSEVTPGLHGQCGICGRMGRRWVGTYFRAAQPGKMPYSLHRSDPLCAWHTIEMQRREMGLQHWRGIRQPAPS